MSRRYQKKVPVKHLLTADQLKAATLLISQGTSKRQAALQVGVKESTLRKRLKVGNTADHLGRFSSTFTKAQEDEIYDYAQQCGDLYYGVTLTSLRKLIFEYAELNNVSNRFNKSLKLVGRDWAYRFLQRYPQLKLRQETHAGIARTKCCNKNNPLFFYKNLVQLNNKHNYAPSRIYNMNEIGVNTVPNNNPNMMLAKERKAEGVNAAEIDKTITLVFAMSATSNFVPPAFIFPRKKMLEYLLKNAPERSVGIVLNSGIINTDLFIEYLRHFKDNVHPTKDDPVLLILDNHSSHISLAAIRFCRDNGIHMLTPPTSSSHRIQPLDHGFFKPLKIIFVNKCDKWLKAHPDHEIGHTEIAELINEALKKAASHSNVITGFKESGIWPIDRDILLEDCSVASATDEISDPNIETKSFRLPK